MTKSGVVRRLAQLLIFTLTCLAGPAQGQILLSPLKRPAQPRQPTAATERSTAITSQDSGNDPDPVQGFSAEDLIRKALTSNAELAAGRLDLERARARLRQAGLRPNPAIEFEQTTGRPTGSPGERATSVGFALPLELGGQRGRRIDLARAELAAAEAELADRERKLGGEVRTAYVEALAALREMQTTEELNLLDQETARVIEARVAEGESAPLELSLQRVELDRLRARRALAEGKLQTALLRLKVLAGMGPAEVLRLRESISAPAPFERPASLTETLEVALRERPDLRLARLNEEVAQAGLRLAQAQGSPGVTVSTTYSSSRSITDLPDPLISAPDRALTLSFGVSIELPIFKRNQGTKAEAAVAITQAQLRRELAEQRVRSEVTAAHARYRAAQAALATFEQGVMGRSAANVETLREAYRLGAFRVTELLAEQRRLVDSQREYTELLVERDRAMADLQTTVGRPLQ